MDSNKADDLSWKRKWYVIIFHHHTRAGRLFDEMLLIFILTSVLVVFIDSSQNIHDTYRFWLSLAEWVLTIIFTIEYIVRIIVVPKKRAYILSFYGIIDLISIIPSYLSIFLVGSQFLIIIRVLRLLRVFRIMKLVSYTTASIFLLQALKSSREKILVFFGAVLLIVTIIGTIMYLVEGPVSGFTSIPTSIYWAIVTITTVGYGDISPTTAFGQIIASVLMLTGYAIIAVPTGILTSELSRTRKSKITDEKLPKCNECGYVIIDNNANFCSNCGSGLS